MEELDSSILPVVTMAVSAAAVYARAVSSRVRPGLARLAALLPVAVLFAAAPLAFSSAALRVTSALFLAWLGTFKVALLAAGHGPLDPGLPVLPFLFIAALPVELRRRRRTAKGSADGTTSSVCLASLTFKASVIAAILNLNQQPVVRQHHRYIRYSMYVILLWFSLEVLFTCAAAAGSVLAGMDTEPHPFVRPYLASSLRDFWGRRWNLVVSGVLRESVYNPLRGLVGKEAAIMATFAVSGLMHEALVYYFMLRAPTGGMAAFFLINGACRVAEERCAARWWPWPPPPRPVATLLLSGFFTATTFWLVFPPVCQ